MSSGAPDKTVLWTAVHLLLSFQLVPFPSRSLTPSWRHSGEIIPITHTERMVVAVAAFADNYMKYASPHGMSSGVYIVQYAQNQV